MLNAFQSKDYVFIIIYEFILTIKQKISYAFNGEASSVL